MGIHSRSRSSNLNFLQLEDRTVPAGFVVAAPQFGDDGIVRILDGSTGAEKMQIVAFAGLRTGLNVAASADRNRDGLPDRIAVGTLAGTVPHVKVFNGATGALLQSFYAYDTAFLGGVNVAFANINGDFYDEVITGAAAGTSPHVKVFDGLTQALIQSFFAFDGAFVGGVRVTAGDLDHDGQDDIIVGAGPGAGSHVKVFRGSDLALLSSKIIFETEYHDGVNVSVSEATGNGYDNLVVERASGTVRFRAFGDSGLDGPSHDINDGNGADN